VILDVKMPVMDGIQAAEEIAKERLAAILILTAFSQRDLVEKARRAGAMAYLVKPFQKHDLLPAVEIAAGRFREMSGLEREVDDLQGRLEARKLVEKAKGLLQEHEGMSEAEAFRFVQRQAMERRLTMKQVAEQVIDDAGPEPGADHAMHQQEGVARPGVPSQHDERAVGGLLALLGRQRLGGVDVERHPQAVLPGPDQGAEVTAHQPVVGPLPSWVVQVPTEPAGDPHAGHDDEGDGFGQQQDGHEQQQAQWPQPARQQRGGERGGQGDQRQGRQEKQRQQWHDRCQDRPTDPPRR
jgi:AmiR/NasT family two-component response regulator